MWHLYHQAILLQIEAAIEKIIQLLKSKSEEENKTTKILQVISKKSREKNNNNEIIYIYISF